MHKVVFLLFFLFSFAFGDYSIVFDYSQDRIAIEKKLKNIKKEETYPVKISKIRNYYVIALENLSKDEINKIFPDVKLKYKNAYYIESLLTNKMTTKSDDLLHIVLKSIVIVISLILFVMLIIRFKELVKIKKETSKIRYEQQHLEREYRK